MLRQEQSCLATGEKATLMSAPLPVIEYWRDRIEDHPLHEWLVEPQEGVNPEDSTGFPAGSGAVVGYTAP